MKTLFALTVALTFSVLSQVDSILATIHTTLLWLLGPI